MGNKYFIYGLIVGIIIGILILKHKKNILSLFEYLKELEW